MKSKLIIIRRRVRVFTGDFFQSLFPASGTSLTDDDHTRNRRTYFGSVISIRAWTGRAADKPENVPTVRA